MSVRRAALTPKMAATWCGHWVAPYTECVSTRVPPSQRASHRLRVELGVIGSAPLIVVIGRGETRTFEVRWSGELGVRADRDTNLIVVERTR
jgi:hypothetical protein